MVFAGPSKWGVATRRGVRADIVAKTQALTFASVRGCNIMAAYGEQAGKNDHNKDDHNGCVNGKADAQGLAERGGTGTRGCDRIEAMRCYL